MRILLISVFIISLIGLVSMPDAFGMTHVIDIPRGSSTTNCNATYACFTPDKIEVERNDIVKWRNLDSTAHTVTSRNGEFDSGPLLINIKQNTCFPNCSPTFSYEFNEYGIYNYSCKIHSWMQGIVIVTSVGSDAEISASGEGGTAFVDKALYQMIPDKNTLVKIYGTLVNPRGGTTVFMSVTFPDGHIEELEVNKTTSGYYETFLNIGSENRGKFSVDVRFEYKNIGTVTFEVVDAVSITDTSIFGESESSVSLLTDSTDTVTVKTNLQSYEKGSAIHISGTVPKLVQSDPNNLTQLTLRITDPRNNIVTVSQLNPNVGGTYFASINGEGPMWKFGGDYTVMVNYGGQSASTTFAFIIPNTPFTTSSKTSTVLTLNQLPSTFETTVQNPDGNPAARMFVSGTLMSTDGQYVITNAEIRFMATGFAWGSTASTTITDENGEFEATWTLPVRNGYGVSAIFDGTSDFRPSQSQTEYFAVISGPMSSQPQDDGTAGGVFLLVILVILVAVIIAIKKRKKGTKFADSAVDELQTGSSKQRTILEEPTLPKGFTAKAPPEIKPTLPKNYGFDTFTRLKDYIAHARDQQANYQPVMIRTLLKNNGYCPKESIVNELHLCNANEKRNWTFYKTVPVYDVLEKNGIVKKEANGDYSLIGFENITPVLRDTLIGICDEKIKAKQDDYTAPIVTPSEEETHYLLLRHKIQNQWADDLGKKYHYGTTVPHYKKLKPGTKTVWYDKKQGDYYLWGFGTVSKVRALPMHPVEKITHQSAKFNAHFTDFKQFEEDQPIKASNHIQEKIAECFSNIQHSIIVINKEIFDEITSMVQSTPVSENIPHVEFNAELFQNKNLFMINGPWVNWEHSLNNRTSEGHILWATRGADPSDMGIYNKLDIDDIIFFSNSTKDPGPFSRKVIFGFGKAKRKFEGTEPYWPDEFRENKVIYRYRFEFEPLFETYDDETTIPWIRGLPFTKGFNSIANPHTIAQLLGVVISKWSQSLLEAVKSKLTSQQSSDKKPHPEMFDADGNYVSREERSAEEEDLDYESEAPTGFSDWENKIKRRFERSGIEFKSGDTRNFDDLYYEGKKLHPYNPDFILKKYKKNKRTIILEAHEKLTLLALQQHYAFLQQSGGQYYIFIIVKNEEYKKWQEQNERKKFCDEVISESKLSNLLTELYFMKQRTHKPKPDEPSTGKSKVMICINEECKKQFVEKNFYDKFGEIQEGELHQFCPKCRKEFE